MWDHLRQAEIDGLAGVGLALAVHRLVLGILLEDDRRPAGITTSPCDGTGTRRGRCTRRFRQRPVVERHPLAVGGDPDAHVCHLVEPVMPVVALKPSVGLEQAGRDAGAFGGAPERLRRGPAARSGRTASEPCLAGPATFSGLHAAQCSPWTAAGLSPCGSLTTVAHGAADQLTDLRSCPPTYLAPTRKQV